VGNSKTSIKAVKKLAKTIRMNFIRTQERNKKFTAITQMFNQEIIAKPWHLQQSLLNH